MHKEDNKWDRKTIAKDLVSESSFLSSKIYLKNYQWKWIIDWIIAACEIYVTSQNASWNQQNI